MSFVVESVVSAAIKVLFEKFASTDLLHFSRRKQILADLEKWKKTLMKIEAVLDDAEEKQMTNKLVEIWLGELKDLAFDVEDLLDEFATEALRRKLVNEPQASTSKFRKFLPTFVTGLSPRSLKLNSSMASQIKKINSRLQKIVEEKEAFDLNVNSRASTNQIRQQRPLTTSLNEPQIYGRDYDKKAILELLLQDEKAAVNCSVISIQGMGGLGKTTLAQLVYNDARVKAHFDVTAWTCVSGDFNLLHHTKTILQCVDDETGDITDLNLLQVKLKEQLAGKKFFIVLDDVWEESYENWTKLCLPFQAASFGSKIIVTTQKMGVSTMVGALPPYLLEGLPHGDCLSIFAFHSLGGMNFDQHQDLKGIGEQIVWRCNGLPLAAKALGGLLRGKTGSKDWNEVLKCNLWSSSEDKSGIIPALRVSYYCLPAHLKRCFAYCSIFPKDYEFHKEELIMLWMVEGFLETRSPGKLREDLGDEYFNDLLSRSFFQQSNTDTHMSAMRDLKFAMHGLINDLAQWASKDASLRIDDLHKGEQQWKVPTNLRYLSCVNSDRYLSPVNSELDYACVQNFIASNEMKRLRTFMSFSSSSTFKFWKMKDFDFPLALLQLQFLKVVSLNGYPISMLPEEIGDLKLLRHIDFSHTLIKFLPDSINKLHRLEVLLLKGCSKLERLCPNMGNLIKLQLLCISYAPRLKLENVPLRIGRSTFQKLEKNDEGLENLQLKWTVDCDDSSMKLAHKLISLEIKGHDDIPYRKWLHDISSSLVSLKIEHCSSLPSLGQLPSLKELVITHVSGVKSLGSDFYGPNNSKPFRSLEQLHISYWDEWTEWIPYDSGRDVIAFPCLQVLSIFLCWKLQGKLPDHLPSLESLTISCCPELAVSIPKLPDHCHISLRGCKVVDLESIKNYCPNLHLLSGISRDMLVVEGVADRSSKVGKLDVLWLEEPKSFSKFEAQSIDEINGISSYYLFSHFFDCTRQEIKKQELPSRCQYLALKGCESLEKLEQLLKSLTFLRVLSLRDANFMTNLLLKVPLPLQLRSLLIHSCTGIECLPEAWMHSSNNSLEMLVVENASLKCIFKQLPQDLKRLFIKKCSLVTIWDEEEVTYSCSTTSHLVDSQDESCPLLTPTERKSYKLLNSIGEIHLSDHASLVGKGNEHVVRISSSSHNYVRLEELTLVNCEKLESLPVGINNLTSLRTLAIEGCPIASIPDGGLPTSLTCLVVKHTVFCKSLFEWGLHKLTSLKLLRIDGCEDVTSFPQEETGMVLPTSLIGLRIKNFPNMECLSSTAQSQPCLKYLHIRRCKKLKRLPDDGLLLSLEKLSIHDCPLLCRGGELMNKIDFSNIPGMPQMSEVIIKEFWDFY